MQEHNRPNPDKLLASIKKEEEATNRGKLKIFFGMSPGVGKTYTMLQTAQIDKSKGIDVVVGYVESHNRPETNALLDGLEVIPQKQLEYKGTILKEMDLDAILLRHPYLVLVDELAHTNAEGCRHNKRYQDVQELLDNGINVYTTVNIQHLESRNDTVAQITGVTVSETLPDEIFEMADEVELIDVTPNTLLERLAEGKIYAPERSKEAIQNFFRKGNITALREMSLRLVADRVDKQLKSYMQQKNIQGPWKSGLHLMVLIGPSKSSAKLVRWAKNLSYTMGADLMAVHVESTQELNDADKDQLAKNIDLAREFGAQVVITSGVDLISTVLEIAHLENITHIIIGKSGQKSFWSSLFSKGDFVTRLLKECGDIDVYVIEPGIEAKEYKPKFFSKPVFSSTYKDYIISVLAVISTMLLCWPISEEVGYQSISFIFLFVVSIIAIFFRLGPVLLSSGLMALSWNFFFIPPLFTFNIFKTADFLAFLMFFFIALLSGILTSRVRKHERLTRKRERKTNALFHLTNRLVSAEGVRSVIAIARDDINKYFGVHVIFLLKNEHDSLKRKDSNSKLRSLSESEYSIALWVYKHLKKAGKFTETLPSSEYTFYPLKSSQSKLGVVAVKLKKTFSGETELFWETFLAQISNALEHQHLAYLARRSSLLEDSDKLYKALFNSISNELKIPVASILDISRDLLRTQLSEDAKIELYNKVATSAQQLNILIEHLLNISKIEKGSVSLHLEWCNINDLFNDVENSLKEELAPYHFDIVVPQSMPLVKVDVELIKHVLHNLVHNSCKYSQPNSNIRLKAFYDSEYLVIQEMDRGSGFSAEDLPHIFERYYKGRKEITGLGLGLAIAKGFVEAHKGSISVENRQHGGARFTIKIPTEVQFPTR